MSLLRRVFRLDGDDNHVTHIPSSPIKSGAGRPPADRCHQAPTPSIGDYFLNFLVAKSKHQSVLDAQFKDGMHADLMSLSLICLGVSDDVQFEF